VTAADIHLFITHVSCRRWTAVIWLNGLSHRAEYETPFMSGKQQSLSPAWYIWHESKFYTETLSLKDWSQSRRCWIKKF
jgi:hypothetical protein